MVNTSQKKSLKLNAALNGLQSILNLIFPLITFPYISRVLSVRGVGIYNFSSIYVGYFILIAGLGINTYAVREGAKYRDNIHKISIFARQIFSINIYSTLIAYLLLIVSLLLFKNLRNYAVCITIFSLQIIFTTLGTNWLYVIYEDYAYITIRNIIFKIISIILLFAFVKKNSDYLIYAGITVFSSVGSNIFNYIHAKSFIRLKLTFKMNLRYHLKPILVIFASVMSVSIYLYADNTILGLIKGNYAVGLYSVSTKIYKMSEDILSAILTVTIPRLSMLYGKRLLKEYNKLLSRLFNLLLLLSLPAVTGLIMLNKNIVVLVAGNKYISSATSLAIISWAIIFSLFNWIFSDCVLLPAKRENELLVTTVTTAIINIVINLLTIPIWSYNAAALSTVVSECLAMLMNAYYGKDILFNSKLYKFAIKNFFEAVVGCFAIVLVCLVIKFLVNSLIMCLLISVLLSIIVYFLVLKLLNNSLVNEYFEKTLAIFHV